MRGSIRSLLGAIVFSIVASPALAEPATEYVLPMNVAIDRDVAANFSSATLENLFASRATREWQIGDIRTLPIRGNHCPVRFTLGEVRIIDPSEANVRGT